jgi:hypothetical protein
MTQSTAQGQKAKTARDKAAEDLSRTAQSTSEAARETAQEVVEDTKSFLSTVGEGAAFVAVRTAKEVNRLRQKAKPFIKPVAYTAAVVADPILGIATIATVEGASTVRRRVRELASEETGQE